MHSFKVLAALVRPNFNAQQPMATRQWRRGRCVPRASCPLWATRSAPEWGNLGKSSLKCTGKAHHRRAPFVAPLSRTSIVHYQVTAALRDTALDLIAPLHSTDTYDPSDPQSILAPNIPSIPSDRFIVQKLSWNASQAHLIRWHSASPPGRPHLRYSQSHTRTDAGGLPRRPPSPPPGRVPCGPHHITAITQGPGQPPLAFGPRPRPPQQASHSAIIAIRNNTPEPALPPLRPTGYYNGRATRVRLVALSS